MHSVQSKVLVVTSHSLYRDCLQSAIQSHISDVDIETAASCQLAYESCERCSDALVVFDLDGLPAFSPTEIKRFARRFGNAAILVIGRHTQESEATAYFEAGVTDFRVADSESLEQFCDVIECALRGECSYGPERTRAIFARLQQLSEQVSRIRAIDSMVLTAREMEILQFVDEGKSNKQIATKLHISLHTVKNHIHRILEKLQVSNRREAVHLAYKSGWLKMNVG